MKRFLSIGFCLTLCLVVWANRLPRIEQTPLTGYSPLSEAVVCTDPGDYRVVQIAASMLADDIQRVTGTGAGRGAHRPATA